MYVFCYHISGEIKLCVLLHKAYLPPLTADMFTLYNKRII